MTFTYVGDLSTNLDKARFFLGDTVQNSGPRPDKRNFSDEEIGAIITLASVLTKGIALCFQALASEWTAYANMQREENLWFDARETADKFLKLAKDWQTKDEVTDGVGTLGAGVVTLDFMQKGSA